ncbi:hypothetical protein HDU98_002216, partial [Podochytrium sp. JEL0797]
QTATDIVDPYKSVRDEPITLVEVDAALKDIITDTERYSRPSEATPLPAGFPAPSLLSNTQVPVAPQATPLFQSPPSSLSTNTPQTAQIDLLTREFEKLSLMFRHLTQAPPPTNVPSSVDVHAFDRDRPKNCIWCSLEHHLNQCSHYWSEDRATGRAQVERDGTGKVRYVKRNANGGWEWGELVPFHRDGMRAHFVKPTDDPARVTKRTEAAAKRAQSKSFNVNQIATDSYYHTWGVDTFSFQVDHAEDFAFDVDRPFDVFALDTTSRELPHPEFITPEEVAAAVSSMEDFSPDESIAVATIQTLVQKQRDAWSNGEATSLPVLRSRAKPDDFNVAWPPKRGVQSVTPVRKSPYPQKPADPHAPKRSSPLASSSDPFPSSPKQVESVSQLELKRLVQEAVEADRKARVEAKSDGVATGKGKGVVGGVGRPTTPVKEDIMSLDDEGSEQKRKVEEAEKLAKKKKDKEQKEAVERMQRDAVDAVIGAMLDLVVQLPVRQVLAAAPEIRHQFASLLKPAAATALVIPSKPVAVVVGSLGVANFDAGDFDVFRAFAVNAAPDDIEPSEPVALEEEGTKSLVVSECPKLGIVHVGGEVFATDVLIDYGSMINVVVLSLVRKFGGLIPVQDKASIQMRSAQGAKRKLRGLAIIPMTVFDISFHTPAFVYDDTHESAPFEFLLGMPFVKHARLRTWVDQNQSIWSKLTSPDGKTTLRFQSSSAKGADSGRHHQRLPTLQ